MQTATFEVHTALFWFYTALGSAMLSVTAVFMVVWRVRRDAIAGQLAMLMMWLAVDTLAKAVLRSPQAVVPQEQVLFVSRMAAIGIVTTAAMLVDTYLAAHNGHLSALRRFVLWYRGSNDPIWDRWRNDHHGA